MSEIRAPGCSKLDKNPKNDNDFRIFRHDVNVKFFWRFFVSLDNFSYWSTFHVNIITGSGIRTIFFYKELTRNPEIGNNPVWVLPNFWRLGQVMSTKFGTNVSNRMLLNATKFQGCSFYRFWFIKGKSIAGGGGDWLKLQPPPCQIRVKTKASRGRIINLLVTCRTIWEPSRISSMSFVVFLILKILHNVFSMKNFWNTNNW